MLGNKITLEWSSFYTPVSVISSWVQSTSFHSFKN